MARTFCSIGSPAEAAGVNPICIRPDRPTRIQHRRNWSLVHLPFDLPAVLCNFPPSLQSVCIVLADHRPSVQSSGPDRSSPQTPIRRASHYSPACSLHSPATGTQTNRNPVQRSGVRSAGAFLCLLCNSLQDLQSRFSAICSTLFCRPPADSRNLFFPDFHWLLSGALRNLTRHRLCNFLRFFIQPASSWKTNKQTRPSHFLWKESAPLKYPAALQTFETHQTCSLFDLRFQCITSDWAPIETAFKNSS